MQVANAQQTQTPNTDEGNGASESWQPRRRLVRPGDVRQFHPSLGPRDVYHLRADSRPRVRHLRGGQTETIAGNGMAEAGVFVTLGRRLFVDLNAFDRFLDQQRAQS